MKKLNIVETAIESLLSFGIKANWKELTNSDIDGHLTIQQEKQKIKFNVIVRTEPREHHLKMIYESSKKNQPLLLVAENLYPKVKESLREQGISYLEANGNIHIKQDDIFLWIEHDKSVTKKKEAPNRAFTKTGLKVIYLFLTNPETVNLPYRKIASKTNVGLGNINNVMNGLKESGHIIHVNKKELLLTNKADLLEKWIILYEERLKPSLQIGIFRFLEDNSFSNWRRLQLTPTKTFWGGEPAGDILTNHLISEELTLYTIESKSEIIKNYRLIADPNGNVTIYNKFWEEDSSLSNTAHPVLVYADLINTKDKRCIETAEIIHKKYVDDLPT